MQSSKFIIPPKFKMQNIILLVAKEISWYFPDYFLRINTAGKTPLIPKRKRH